MSKTTIHKNLNLGSWSVGSPVAHCSTVIATGVSFPDLSASKNKQFLNCVAGGSRKVFAKAKADNVYGFNGTDCVVHIEGNAGYIQTFEHIVSDLRGGAETPHLLKQVQRHNMEAVRVRFNPTKGNTYFWSEDRPNEALLWADIVLFAPDGSAYVFRGAS